MSQGPVQRFELGRGDRWMIVLAPWFWLLMAALSLSLPWFPDLPASPWLYGMAGFGALGFGGFAWHGFLTARRIDRMPVALDEEGIWSANLERDSGLLRWGEIAEIRERSYLQRLDLVDRSGVVRLRLEYQLRPFETLRAIVVERAQGLADPRAAGDTFAKSPMHHGFYSAILVVWVVALVYVHDDLGMALTLASLVVMAMIGWEYWTTVYRLRLLDDAVELVRPGRVQRLGRSDIAEIRLDDDVGQNGRAGRVSLHLQGGGKPVHLRDLGIAAHELFRSLQAWRQGGARPNQPDFSSSFSGQSRM